MKIRARAPGKLILLGEYAVLEGGTGLVMAVNHQARVRVTSAPGDRVLIKAPQILPGPLAVSVGDGRLAWPAGTSLPLLDAVLEELCTQGAPATLPAGLSLTLDSGEFFSSDGQTKLGLGSSAALSVALLGALGRAFGLPAPGIEAALSAHRRFQQGRGSGIDVAASFFGGVLSYRPLPDSLPQVVKLDWPKDFQGVAVWSGRGASTTSRLERLERFRDRQGDVYGELMATLCQLAEAGAAGFARGQIGSFLAAADEFAATLGVLDRYAGLQLLTPAHRELSEMGAQNGICYKTSGAGGGDFGLALSDDPEPLSRFTKRAAGAGYLLLPLAPCHRGLQLN